MLRSRNHSLGFAERTRKNLALVEGSFAQAADVHVVTQIANSLLGLIVFPCGRNFVGGAANLQMSELLEHGWPQWEITLGYAHTLGQLVRRLRNATAHGRMSFSSDSRHPEKVYIEVEDFRPRESEPFWRSRIKASELRTFCLKFIDLIDQKVG